MFGGCYDKNFDDLYCIPILILERYSMVPFYSLILRVYKTQNCHFELIWII